jgi:hypothetical protein
MAVQQWAALGFMALSLGLFVGRYLLKQEKYKYQFEKLTATPGVKSVAVFIYFVGLPYLALILGILTPRLLGLTGLEHFTLINWDSPALAVQLQQATTLLLVTWLLDSSTALLAGLAALLVMRGVWLTLAHRGVALPRVQGSALWILYDALHWAFYRAIFWFMTDSLYLGVVLGAGVVVLEWLLVYWPHRRQTTYQQQFMVNTIILLLTATNFYYSPNLWLLLPVHWLLVMIVNGKIRRFESVR